MEHTLTNIIRIDDWQGAILLISGRRHIRALDEIRGRRLLARLVLRIEKDTRCVDWVDLSVESGARQMRRGRVYINLYSHSHLSNASKLLHTLLFGILWERRWKSLARNWQPQWQRRHTDTKDDQERTRTARTKSKDVRDWIGSDGGWFITRAVAVYALYILSLQLLRVRQLLRFSCRCKITAIINDFNNLKRFVWSSLPNSVPYLGPPSVPELGPFYSPLSLLAGSSLSSSAPRN